MSEPPRPPGGSDTLDQSLVHNPWLTVCNVFWGNKLASHPFTVDSAVIPFRSLWPNERAFVELYQMNGMEGTRYDVVKLLLTSQSLAPFEALLNERLLTWEHIFPGNVTLAHLVCALNSEGSIQLLIKHIPQNGLWTTKDSHDRDPLSVCFSPDSRKTIRKQIKGLSSKLFSKNPPTGLPLTKDIKNQIFYHASTPEGLYEMVIMLQMYTFDVNKEKDDEGNTLVHVAVQGGLSCLPQLFYLVNTRQGDIKITNELGLTPLCLAAKIGNEKIVELLVCVFGAGVNSTDGLLSWTSLHYASYHDHPQLLSILLERGADPNQEDSTKCVPSYLAQRSGNVECYRVLIHHINERTQTLAQNAAEGTLNVSELSSTDIYLITKDGFTLLMKAVLGNQLPTVRALLNTTGCPIDFRQTKPPEPVFNENVGSPIIPPLNEQTLKTAVTMAAENGYGDCLRLLLDSGAHPAIEDNQSWLPIHYAAARGHKECVRILVSHSKGLTGLQLASRLAEANGRMDIVKVLNDAMQKRQQEIVNPVLFEVAGTGDKNLLYQLVENGDDVNPTNEMSEWPLYIAAGLGYIEVVKMLYEHGGNVVRYHRLNLSTPLHQAARGGHEEIVKFLLKFCHPTQGQTVDPNKTYLSVNEKNAMGVTPLELAVSQGYMKVVQLLLDNGAVTTLPDSNGQLLSCPAFCGIQFLLESRRKEQMDRIVKALQEQKTLKEFRSLWKGPSDFNLRDGHGDTALMVAARYAKPDVVEFLLQSARFFTADMKINWTSRNLPKHHRRRRSGYNSSFEESLQSETPYGCFRRQESIGERPRPHTAMDPQIIRSKKQLTSSFSQFEHTYQPNSITDNSSDDDRSISGEYIYLGQGVAVDDSRLQQDIVTLHGPCTQSGVVCLINIRDRRTALHRAVEGNQHKVIPLLLMADPKVTNLQDKNGHSALHLACQMNLKNCATALFSCRGIPVNTILRDSSNNMAEELAIKPRLKKMVSKYREKQMKSIHPANRPLPSLPPPATSQYLPNYIPGSAMHLPPPHPVSTAHLSRASSANAMPRGSTTHLSRTPLANGMHPTPVGSMTHLASPVYASTPHHNAPSPLMDPYQQQYVPEHPSQVPPFYYGPTMDDDDMRSVVSRRSRGHGPMNGPVPHRHAHHARIPSNGRSSDNESLMGRHHLPAISSPPLHLPSQFPPSPSHSVDSNLSHEVRMADLRHIAYNESSEEEYSDHNS